MIEVEPMSENERNLWDAVHNLQELVAELRRELNQHYSNHVVAHNTDLDRQRQALHGF